MRHLSIKKVSVIGLSYGSSCATDFAIAYPEQVEKMILVSPGLTGWEKALQPDSVSAHYFQELDSAFTSDNFERIAKTFTKAWCDGPFRQEKQVPKDAREYVYSTALKNLKQHKEDTWGNFSTSTAAENVHRIDVPVLLIYGDQDIPFVETVSHFVTKKISGSTEKKIPGVAHMLNLEAGDSFNTMIIDFLK
jgi:3-oxoadipate enol-lactonase